MDFQHAPEIWKDFITLVPGVILAEGITAEMTVDRPVTEFIELARTRLSHGTEAEWPEIVAWRRAFARMGLKPTQYRCAAESLLRRLRKEGTLPRIHPLVDLCNAVSVAHGVPVAVLDTAKLSGRLEVRYATGDERYRPFAGDLEHPTVGEVVFADADGWAHARRWTNRQSGLSAVRESTSTVLIVAEAMHDSAFADVPRLLDAIAGELKGLCPVPPKRAILRAQAPRFDW